MNVFGKTLRDLTTCLYFKLFNTVCKFYVELTFDV